MRRPLTRPRLDAAREPLSRLARRGWIWRGRQTLDGVFLPRDAAPDGDPRPALIRFLGAAQAVRSGADGWIVLFDAPQEMDCGSLGRALPLRRLHGALSSFPFEPPRSSDISKAIDGRLLSVEGGAARAAALSTFEHVDLSDWIDLSDLAVAAAEAPPARATPERLPRALKIDGVALSAPEDADAGFAELRKAMRAKPARAPLAIPKAARDVLIIVGIVTVMILAAALGAGGGGVGGLDGEALLVGAVSMAATFLLVALISWLARTSGKGGRPGAARPGGAAGAATQPGGAASASSGGRGLPGVPRWAWLLVVIGSIGVIIALEGPGSSILIILLATAASIAVAYAVGMAIGALIGAVVGAIFGGGSSAGGRALAAKPPASRPPSGAPRGPNAFQRWLDRLLQRTPMSEHALGKYARRVRELERLFAEGRVDEALKKALAVDPREPEKPMTRADLPIKGPGIRDRLMIEARQPAGRHPLASLPPGARDVLSKLYREQAQKSLEAGDIEHAAFIHAELLGDAEAAVKIFADAQKYETAARLAQGRELAPGVFIPLWARAGKLDHALALAERHGAYEMLLAATDPADHAFRAEVRRRWSRRLASVGAFDEALKVSAPLATEDEAFRALRLEWMTEALARPDPDPTVVVRAAKALPAEGGPGDDIAFAAIAAVIEEEGEAAAIRRRRVVEGLLKTDLEPEHTAAFDAWRMPRIADRLPRRLMEDHVAYGGLSAIGAVRALAEAGGQSALAADLRTVPRRRQTTPASKGAWRLKLGAIRGATAVVAAAPMQGGRTLVGYEDGRLVLLDRLGRERWSERLWRVRDVIGVAPSRVALVIREEPDGQKLSILDIDRLRHVEIGPTAFTAWAPHATERGWLVYDGGSVLDLRTAPLIAALEGAPPDHLERHWATPIVIEGEVLALARAEMTGDTRWIFRRVDGVVERWEVAARTLKVSYNVIRLDDAVGALASDDLSRFERIDTSGRLHTTYATPIYRETQGITPAAPPIMTRAEPMHPTRAVLTPIRREPGDAWPSYGLINSTGPVSLTVILEGAKTVEARDGRHLDTATLRDDLGRLVILSTSTGETLYANAELNDAGA